MNFFLAYFKAWQDERALIKLYRKRRMSLESFTTWFRSKNFNYFDAKEFTSYFSTHRRGVTNSPPDRALWENIVPTLRVVDRLRAHFGRPIVILSSYRSPEYNAAITGAASKSYHKSFQALDIAVSGKSPEEVFAVLSKWRAEGDFKGGLGLYSTFVHIDTRGHNATW